MKQTNKVYFNFYTFSHQVSTLEMIDLILLSNNDQNVTEAFQSVVGFQGDSVWQRLCFLHWNI